MGDYQKEVFLKSPLKKICFDVNGTILWANEAYAKAFGKNRTDIEGTPFVDYLAEENRSAFLRHLQTVSSEPFQKEFFLEVTLKGVVATGSEDTGSVLDAVVIRSENGTIRYFSGWLRSSEEKKKILEQKTAATQGGHNSPFNRALCMVVDENGIMTSFEGYMAENYIPDPVGKHYKEIYQDRPQNQIWIERALAGETFQVEVDYEGTWYHIWYMPVKDVSGNIKGATWTAWPADYYRQRQFELHQKLQKEKNEFLSVASHEIKNPLSILSLQLEWLNRHLSNENTSIEVRKKAIDLIKKGLHQVSRISTLTERTLNSKALEKDRINLAPKRFNFVDLVESTVSDFCALYPSHSDSFKIVAPTSLEVFWDEGYVEEILDNLFSNAIKYGEAPFILEVENHIPGKVTFKLTDHGKGISPKSRARIFNRYDRTGSPTEVKGLGLGLYIVKNIVDTFNGTVSVDCDSGKGTTFSVSLPNPLATNSQTSRPSQLEPQASE